jgi:choline dehydrogenase-like flavoprotein
MHGRQVHVPRGRFLGGSSGCNGTICVRGVKQDYDDWGVPEWSGDEMFRAMRKVSVLSILTITRANLVQSENFHPQKWFPENKNAHGYDGPLHIEPSPCGPLGDLFLKNYQSKGLPYHPDMFSTGETANGCGHALRTTWKGNRTTAADFITKDHKRPNITIKCHSTVDKVILERDSNGKLQAKGAEYLDKDGNRVKALARKEVVLTAGTYASPAILQRSGIGAKADLQALNIPCEVDLPGVGENLQDHQLIFIYYELNKAGLTDDERVNHDPNAWENGVKQWKKDKTGWLATFPFGSFAFARLDDRLVRDTPEWNDYERQEGRDPMQLTDSQPNLEFFHTVCYGGPPEYTDKPKEGQYAFAMCCFLCGLQSRGSVKLKSTDANENPEVDHKYFSDRRDLLMMSEGVRFANEIVTTGEGTKDLIKGAWPPGAKHHLYKTNEDWQPFVQKYASTSYHPGGTCKLGKDGDKTAVVDAKLRVRGVSGLRVADCSVMPTLHSGHTQMPAYGIAEKAAEYLKEAAAQVNGQTNGVNGVNGHH